MHGYGLSAFCEKFAARCLDFFCYERRKILGVTRLVIDDISRDGVGDGPGLSMQQLNGRGAQCHARERG